MYHHNRAILSHATMFYSLYKNFKNSVKFLSLFSNTLIHSSFFHWVKLSLTAIIIFLLFFFFFFLMKKNN